MFYLVPVPKQFVDFSGVPYSGGFVTVYVHGTTDKAQIYAEADSSVLLHNPCHLDSNGAWKCFVPADTPLDYIVQDRDGNVVASYANIVMPMIDAAVTKGYVDSQDQLRDKNFAADYDPSQAYSIVGTYVIHEGRLYKSAVVIDEPEEWNVDHWTECNVTDELNAKIAAEAQSRTLADSALSATISAETLRAQTAEAAAKTEVVQGENCTIEKTTAADGHDVYTVNADGKPQVQSDWNQADSSEVDYIKNKPNLGLKADKVQGATAGNFAALDVNGNLTDSGSKSADFKTKQTPVTDPSASGAGLEFIDSVTQDANGEITPHKKAVQDGTTAQKGVVQLNNAIDSSSTTEAATPKAVKDAYDELNNKIVARAVFLSQQEWAAQSLLPGDPAKVYYVENGTGEDAYTVYVWKESTSTYEEVDESSIDLDGYWHDSPTTTGNGNVVTNITLGNDGVPQVEKGLTALTQHQSVTDNDPTLAWSTRSKVGTIGSTDLHVTMPSNPASGKLDTTGDASNTTSTFTKASGDTSSMTSGGKLSAIFTAISSIFASLKALAFKDKVSDSDISGTISDSHIASANTWNGKQNSLGIDSSSGDTSKYLNQKGGWTTPTQPTIDQTYSASSTNAQSGTAVAQAIGTKQDLNATTLTSSDNLDNIVVGTAGQNKWYKWANANAPTGVSSIIPGISSFSGVMQVVCSYDGNYCEQIVYRPGSETTFCRYCYNGTWSAWKYVAYSTDIPSVINSLTSTSTTDALSAAQGKALKDLMKRWDLPVIDDQVTYAYIGCVSRDSVGANAFQSLSLTIAYTPSLTNSNDIYSLTANLFFRSNKMIADLSTLYPNSQTPKLYWRYVDSPAKMEFYVELPNNTLHWADFNYKASSLDFDYSNSGKIASLPADCTLITNTTSKGVGSISTPVYVDPSGQVQSCTPSSMSVGSATNATNVNLSKIADATIGDTIKAGNGSSVLIDNAGNAYRWGGYRLSFGTFSIQDNTICIV